MSMRCGGSTKCTLSGTSSLPPLLVASSLPPASTHWTVRPVRSAFQRRWPTYGLEPRAGRSPSEPPGESKVTLTKRALIALGGGAAATLSSSVRGGEGAGYGGWFAALGESDEA